MLFDNKQGKKLKKKMTGKIDEVTQMPIFNYIFIKKSIQSLLVNLTTIRSISGN